MNSSVWFSFTTEVWVFLSCMTQAQSFDSSQSPPPASAPSHLFSSQLPADSLGQPGRFSVPAYMERQPFGLWPLLGVSLLTRAAPRPLLLLSGRTLSSWSLNLLVPLGASLTVTESPPCF